MLKDNWLDKKDRLHLSLKIMNLLISISLSIITLNKEANSVSVWFPMPALIKP